MKDISFAQSRDDPDLWMTLHTGSSDYDYITLYVDDFLICAKDSEHYVKLMSHDFEIKNENLIQIITSACLLVVQAMASYDSVTPSTLRWPSVTLKKIQDPP